ncbi:NAD(P)-binding protein [Plenodomus tracheiphilus IPT5]|uniref:NAD(P)-binding protein n=1 Tax=Plenodomus tracheiphilus IPT5 TaxID=1408161 RepID=A0A6A7BCF7_9PLEO|nr:NAD(P)-binding protein [Plenodomus tracheiphilus IPT5]
MASVLVTGAARGLGLALVKQLVSRPSSEVSKIIAAVRGDAPAVDEIVSQSSGRVSLVKLDITNSKSIDKAVAETKSILGEKGLDVLVNNAGICQYAFGGVVTMDNLEESFKTNVMGIHWTTQGFLPLLQIGTLKKVANISTTLGSITLASAATALPAPAYKISKAAMNALTVQYALEYEKEGFTFIALCPGWLKTDLGGGDMADLTPEEGAKASLDLIFQKGQGLNGKLPKIFVKGWENAKGPNVYDGSNAPW